MINNDLVYAILLNYSLINTNLLKSGDIKDNFKKIVSLSNYDI